MKNRAATLKLLLNLLLQKRGIECLILKKTAVRIEFGKRLKRKRQERDFTQEMLAERAGIAPNYVGSVERGERNIGLENIVLLAKALGVAPKDLMPDSE